MRSVMSAMTPILKDDSGWVGSSEATNTSVQTMVPSFFPIALLPGNILDDPGIDQPHVLDVRRNVVGVRDVVGPQLKKFLGQ